MTFALPATNDDCDLTRSAADPLWVADINSPTNTGVKANGSLPHPDDATEFDNNANATTKGYAKEFTSGGAGHDVSTDTKLLLWHNQWNAPNRIQVDTVANAGMSLKIFTGTVNGSNWREFYVGGNDTPQGASISGQFPFIIDLNDSSHDATNGTYDNTDVTGVAILQTRLNIAGTNTNWNYQGKMWIIDTTKSSSSTPTFSGAGTVIQDIVTEVQGVDFSDKLGSWVRQIGSVIFIDFGFRIGNNSTITAFDDEGKTIISPITNDSADPSKRLTLQACRVYLNLRNNAADTALFTGTWKWGTRALFDFDQDDAAVVTFTNPTFIGMGAFTLGSSITGAATWDDVDPVIFADTGVDVDGSTFKNQNGSYALEMTAGAMDIANMRFESYASAHAILIDTAGTYEFSNVFFDESGTNEVETTHSSGVVTIDVVNGGTVPGVTVTGAGTVVVNNALPLEITGLTEGTPGKIIANETIGTITVGDVLLTGFANSSGVVAGTINYEAAFDPSGLDVIVRARNQGVAVAAIAEDGGVFVDETDEASSNTVSDMTLLPAVPVVNDAYNFGHDVQFSKARVDISTAMTETLATQQFRMGIDGGISFGQFAFGSGAGAVITWEYYNGATFASLSGVVDGTNGFGNTGDNVVSFTVPGDWATTTINGQGPLFYIRARLSSLGSITTAPVGRRVTLDTQRFLPYAANRTVVSGTGLVDSAAWTQDNISQFEAT